MGLVSGRFRQGLQEELAFKLKAEGSEEATKLWFWSGAAQVADANALW